MYQILLPAGPASDHFWQVRSNLAIAEFLDCFRIWPDLAVFGAPVLHVDCLQLNVRTLVLHSHHLSDFMV